MGLQARVRFVRSVFCSALLKSRACSPVLISPELCRTLTL
jgi:hypothetical protein